MTTKILFWISGDLTHYFIANYVQKHCDCELYAIIDVTNRVKKFFEKQTIVKFKKVWFFHDHIKTNLQSDFNYLQNVEKKYNVNIWKLAINERMFYRFFKFHKFNTKEILSIEESACKLFESVLGEVNPKFFITKEPTFHHIQLFYEMCRAKDIIPLILGRPSVSESVIVSQKRHTVDLIDKLDNVKPKGYDFEELQKYVDKHALPRKINYYNEIHGGRLLSKIRAAYDFFIKSDNSNAKDHYNYFGRTKTRVFLYTLSETIKLCYRGNFINRNLKKNADFNSKFVYYPMAMDLESMQLIESPFYNNQIEIIRFIVKSLPPGCELYVKEAPGQKSRQWRSISEYKEILNIPNVTFFHPSVKNVLLLKNCSLVITIGGTSGLEAAVYGKPSIIFSDRGYDILPSVFRVREIESLPQLIRKALETKVNPVDVDKYFTLCENESIDINYFDLLQKQLDAFFYSGSQHDAEIAESKVISYLEKNEHAYEALAKKHVEKIQKYNDIN